MLCEIEKKASFTYPRIFCTFRHIRNLLADYGFEYFCECSIAGFSALFPQLPLF